MAGAVKFNPSFNIKLENVIDSYLNETFELWYIANWATIQIKKDSDYDSINCLKTNIRSVRKTYPNKNIKRLTYKDIEKYFYEFKKLKTFKNVSKNILFKYNVDTVLDITECDVPENYLKILNTKKLNVKLSMKNYDKLSYAFGLYRPHTKKIIVPVINIFEYYRHSFIEVKDTFICILRHEYIHHMQNISNYFFAMPTKYNSVEISYNNFSTDDDYANHASRNIELYPMIDSYAYYYQDCYEKFNNICFDKFIKLYSKRLRKMQENNPKKYKAFISALYVELQRRFEK